MQTDEGLALSNTKQSMLPENRLLGLMTGRADVALSDRWPAISKMEDI